MYTYVYAWSGHTCILYILYYLLYKGIPEEPGPQICWTQKYRLPDSLIEIWKKMIGISGCVVLHHCIIRSAKISKAYISIVILNKPYISFANFFVGKLL